MSTKDVVVVVMNGQVSVEACALYLVEWVFSEVDLRQLNNKCMWKPLPAGWHHVQTVPQFSLLCGNVNCCHMFYSPVHLLQIPLLPHYVYTCNGSSRTMTESRQATGHIPPHPQSVPSTHQFIPKNIQSVTDGSYSVMSQARSLEAVVP